MRYPQIKNLANLEALQDRCSALGIEIPAARTEALPGSLATPLVIRNGSAPPLLVPNRFAVLPMEGWDGTDTGLPTDLVLRRWANFGRSGCGLVWGEATAVHPDGRANAHQLVIDGARTEHFATLRHQLHPDQVAGLQLTHSGRWARPHGDAAPRIAYRHTELDARVAVSDASVLSDTELDDLVERYIEGAVVAHNAGFDFVDIKHCHGYLLHELLSAYARPGRFGGDLKGRTHFLRSVVSGIRTRAPGMAIAVRLSAFDMRPFTGGPDAFGVPQQSGQYSNAFGCRHDGLTVDLAETHELFEVFEEIGIGLVSVTAGSPYYNPHIQRPAFFPPSDGYQPPEDPLVGVARQINATKELAEAFPKISIVGSAYSYLQDFLAEVALAAVDNGAVAMVGLGRVALSYPRLAHDVLMGNALDRRLVCRTFSDCTTAPRHGLVSGCFPIDPFYKAHPDRVELTKVKRKLRNDRRESS